jgi:glycosyl transferase family 25
VSAVDGNGLPKICADAPDHEYVLSRSEIACAQSHQKCWDLFERSRDACCVVLEDDVHFGEDFAAFMASAPTLPADFDLIKIESVRKKVWLDRKAPHAAVAGGRALLRLASKHMGSAGYVLSRTGLEKLRGLTRTIDYPIDEILFGQHLADLTIYQMAPAIVAQDRVLEQASPEGQALASSIAGDSGRRPRLSRASKLLREIRRPFRYVVPPGPLRAKFRLRCGEVGFR